MIDRGTGWLEEPRPLAERVRLGEGVFDAPPDNLPLTAEQWRRIPRWRDQGWTNSCVGHGCASALELLRVLAGLPDVPLSPAHTYWLARALSGLQGTDGGAYTLDGVRSLMLGVALEQIWPLRQATINERPPGAADIDGVYRTVARYDRITAAPFTEQRERLVMAALADGAVVLTGKRITERFQSYRDGVLAPPTADEPRLGGHLTYYAGYRTEAGGSVSLFEANSWGREWGRGGAAWVDIGWVHYSPDLVALHEASEPQPEEA